MRKFLLSPVQTETIPENILKQITERQKAEIESILQSNWDIGEITQKIQNTGSLYTFVLNFYAESEEAKNYRLFQVIELAKLFPQYFFQRFYSHFERILKSPIPFKEKIRRLKKIQKELHHDNWFWWSKATLDINKYARIVTLSEDFDTRFTLASEIDALSQGLLADEVWWIFRWRWVTPQRLESAINKMKKYSQKSMNIRLADCIPDNFDKIIEMRKKLFEWWMNNILSQDQIDEICRSFQVETKYLEINIKKYLDSDKRAKNSRERESLVYELIHYSNAQYAHYFKPKDKHFWEEIPF